MRFLLVVLMIAAPAVAGEVKQVVPLPIVELAPATVHPPQQPKYQDEVWVKVLKNDIGWGAGAEYAFRFKKSGWWSVGILFPRVEELQASLAGPTVIEHHHMHHSRHGWYDEHADEHSQVVMPNLFSKVDETNSWTLVGGWKVPLPWGDRE